MPFTNCAHKIKIAILSPFHKKTSLREIHWVQFPFICTVSLFTPLMDRRAVHTVGKFLFRCLALSSPISPRLGHISFWKSNRMHFCDMTFLGNGLFMKYKHLKDSAEEHLYMFHWFEKEIHLQVTSVWATEIVGFLTRRYSLPSFQIKLQRDFYPWYVTFKVWITG